MRQSLLFIFSCVLERVEGERDIFSANLSPLCRSELVCRGMYSIACDLPGMTSFILFAQCVVDTRGPIRGLNCSGSLEQQEYVHMALPKPV